MSLSPVLLFVLCLMSLCLLSLCLLSLGLLSLCLLSLCLLSLCLLSLCLSSSFLSFYWSSQCLLRQVHRLFSLIHVPLSRVSCLIISQSLVVCHFSISFFLRPPLFHSFVPCLMSLVYFLSSHILLCHSPVPQSYVFYLSPLVSCQPRRIAICRKSHKIFQSRFTLLPYRNEHFANV